MRHFSKLFHWVTNLFTTVWGTAIQWWILIQSLFSLPFTSIDIFEMVSKIMSKSTGSYFLVVAVAVSSIRWAEFSWSLLIESLVWSLSIICEVVYCLIHQVLDRPSSIHFFVVCKVFLNRWELDLFTCSSINSSNFDIEFLTLIFLHHRERQERMIGIANEITSPFSRSTIFLNVIFSFHHEHLILIHFIFKGVIKISSRTYFFIT